MNRKEFLKRLLALSAAPALLSACAEAGGEIPARAGVGQSTRPPAGQDITPLKKSREEWRRLLTSDQYEVLFEEDTEFPFSSPLNKEKRAGTYLCAACYLPLFSSRTKFDSGTGWPSFYEPIPGRMGTKQDRSLFMVRTEYHCARCGGHQGHVFDDGPPPTGQRWCNNGDALQFVPEGKPLPKLRT